MMNPLHARATPSLFSAQIKTYSRPSVCAAKIPEAPDLSPAPNAQSLAPERRGGARGEKSCTLVLIVSLLFQMSAGKQGGWPPSLPNAAAAAAM